VTTLKVFSNPTPLELTSADYAEAVREMKLGSFPVIPDFTIELRESEDSGQHVHFVSPTRGELAGFPYWDNAERDMRHFSPEDVPSARSTNRWTTLTKTGRSSSSSKRAMSM